MNKLERKLIRTLEKLSNDKHRTIREFYSLVHEYDKLDNRYKKITGMNYNPVRENER